MTTTDTTNQWIQDLPKVPVPDLHKTLERYLSALKPVIPVAQYEQTRRTVDQFLEADGEGDRLQALLKQWADQTDNWITPIWLEDMYLLNAVPLPINSSPFYLFPRQQFRTANDQLRLAVEVIKFVYDFRNRIQTENLTQDFGAGHGKGQPLCMNTYTNFFRAYRLPGEDKDEILLIDNNKTTTGNTTEANDDDDNNYHYNNNDNSSEHIVIASRNQFFVLQFKRNELPAEDILFDKLKYIWFLAKEYESLAPIVGILTTENRKIWANTRKRLLLSDINKQSLKYLETCLFIVCIDDFVSNKTIKNHQRRDSIQMARMDPQYMASMVLHGGGSQLYTPNRWFDKFLQIVIGKDGILGFICEHSVSEGVTVMRLCEELVNYLDEHPIHGSGSYWQRRDSTKNNQQNQQLSTSTTINTKCPNLHKGLFGLQWDIDDTVRFQLIESTKRIDKLISDVDLYVLQFNEFGKQFIKSQLMSPDAFVQLALQLTYYKVHRKLVSTYESASIRQFRLGRVDNIRSATIEALGWAKAMCDEIPEITEKHKIEMFQKAMRKQTEILKYTISGHGIDNHLLGLREIAKQSASDTPILFREKSFKEFSNFRLSTSQVSNNKGILVGYGPVVPDGYGCSYNITADDIQFSISSFFSSTETSSDFFALSLEGSLLQMREICIKINTNI
ncbi:choline O-acetyltransferase-like [Oppia nitens]|uniref:choline O-acetyltransferase-like n=1 Tax=Oppia nitens TaxID=1686743 RepID=UPI0023DB4DEE|nr:choline O-acetyltransferase-like [Oppia nitens]